jgi:hypothetical protein
MSPNLTLLAVILIFFYIYFYINSKRYLVREYFQGESLSKAYTGKNAGFTVSWPGGVVSPPGFGSK